MAFERRILPSIYFLMILVLEEKKLLIAAGVLFKSNDGRRDAPWAKLRQFQEKKMLTS
jgi:hypothetical protein